MIVANISIHLIQDASYRALIAYGLELILLEIFMRLTH